MHRSPSKSSCLQTESLLKSARSTGSSWSTRTVLGVVEAESRPLLKLFSDRMLEQLDGQPYANVMLIDGNDDRGIDVGILTRDRYPITYERSHNLRHRRPGHGLQPGLLRIPPHDSGERPAGGLDEPLQVQGLQRPR